MKTILLLFTIALLLISKDGYGQNTLPLTRTIWTGTIPSGWTDKGTSSYQSNFACSDYNMGKLNSEGDYYLISFTGSPGKLFFKLKNATLNPFCELNVETSDHGRAFKTIAVYQSKDFQDCTEIILDLNENTQFVKFLYAKKVNNGSFGLDDVKISINSSNKKSNTGGGSATGGASKND